MKPSELESYRIERPFTERLGIDLPTLPSKEITR